MTPRVDRGPLGDVVTVLVVFAVLGVVCGVLWWLAVDLPEYTKTRAGSTMGEVELSKSFNADGWYAVLALVVGFLAGVAVTWWRSRDFRLTTVLLAGGAALAAALTAYVGGLLGPGDPDVALRQAEVGARVPEQLVVAAGAGYLLWPVAALAGALMVLWSSTTPGTLAVQSDEGRPVDLDALPPPSAEQRHA